MIGPLIVTGIAVALEIVIVLCSRGIVGRNPIVGIRVPAFFESDAAWKIGHRRAIAPMSAAVVLCLIVAGLAAGDSAFAGPLAVVVALALLSLGVMLGALFGSRAIRHCHE